MPCNTLGCGNPPRWLFGSVSTRRLYRYCEHCGPEVASKGGFLVLVHSKKEP